MFYNQTGSDEHIDVNSVDDVIIEDNVFFNCFSCSGRTNANDTASFVVVKDSNAGDDEYLGARNVLIRRNVMFNWEGSIGSGFILFGEDGTAKFEAFDSVAENNLLLGNSTNTQRSPLGVKGSRDIVFKHNTVVGNLPANAFATRINREVDNPPIEAIRFVHNIFSDPTGTMQDFSDTLPTDLSVTRPSQLLRNAYFNAANALPNDPADVLNITGDTQRVEGNPQLPAQTNLTLPFWMPNQSQFNGGFNRIRDVFVALVESYGRPVPGSVAFGAATVAADIPVTDILGNARTSLDADLGAVQRVDAGFRNGFE